MAEDSKGNRGFRGVAAVRAGVAALAAAGVVVLVIAEFSPLLRVELQGPDPTVLKTVSTGSHHAYALLLLALVAALFGAGAVRRDSRPALVALAALGLAVLAIAFLVDQPDTGLEGYVRNFEGARTVRERGLYLEMVGGALLLVAGGLGLTFGERAVVRGARPGSGEGADAAEGAGS